MNSQEKRAFVNEAERSFKHPLVESVVDELLFNLNSTRDSLVCYGIHKVANAVAIVARAQALGIDPNELRMNDDEIAEHMQRMMEIAERVGKPVIAVVTE